MTTIASTQNICKLCNQRPAAWNNFVCEDCFKKASFQEKATLVLEGSESPPNDWGLVKLTPGTINHVPADSELIGYWHRWDGGTYWVSIMMPLDALMDRSTLLHAEVARRRSDNLPLMGVIKQPRRATVAKKPKEQEASPQSETVKSLQALRQKILSKEA